VFSMLTKTPRRTAAPANADARDQLINSFKPFAETLAKQLTGSAEARQGLSSSFLWALLAWFVEVWHDKIFAAYKALQKAQDCAITLREHCDEARHEFSNLGLGYIQNQAPENEIPPPTLPPTLRAAISSLIEPAEASIKKYREYQRAMGIEPEPADKPRGRPSGISGFPQLETLIFLLEFHSASHGASLTAYIKKDGELKVAAGSMIDALNILRSYLVKDQSYFWLANFLPLPDEHLTYVSTYQRILAGARIEARDQQAAR
jgi:hypothetical protein